MKRILSHIITIATIFALIATFSSCSRSGSDNKSDSRTLAVSVEPLRHMLEDVAGNKFDVVSMIPAGANPESFEPTLSRRVALDNSVAFFTTGLLPFEQQLEGNLGSGVKVIDVAPGINLIHGTHSHNCHHDADDDKHHHSQYDVDPHIWVSVKNARVIMNNMLNALVNIDPENAEYYRQRHTVADARLDSLDKAFTQRLASAPRSFAVWHPSLTYFARDYGLNQISVAQESKEISPKQLQAIIDNARQHDVKNFFFQRAYDSRQALTINKAIGSKIYGIKLTEYDWENQLDQITHRLANN